jgi:hypothetical protein
MKEPKNGAANMVELHFFDKIVHSATVTEANAHKNHFLANVRDRVGNYADSSIFEGNSSLQRFSDGVIMNMNQNREREGVQ